MRGVAGDEAGQILRFGPFDRKIGRQIAGQRFDTLACRPQLAMMALRIHQRGFDGVPAPQADRAGAGPAAAAPALHPAGASS